MPKVTQLETLSRHRPDVKSCCSEHMQGLGVGPPGALTVHMTTEMRHRYQPLFRCPATEVTAAPGSRGSWQEGACQRGQVPCRVNTEIEERKVSHNIQVDCGTVAPPMYWGEVWLSPQLEKQRLNTEPWGQDAQQRGGSRDPSISKAHYGCHGDVV